MFSLPSSFVTDQVLLGLPKGCAEVIRRIKVRQVLFRTALPYPAAVPDHVLNVIADVGIRFLGQPIDLAGTVFLNFPDREAPLTRYSIDGKLRIPHPTRVLHWIGGPSSFNPCSSKNFGRSWTSPDTSPSKKVSELPDGSNSKWITDASSDLLINV